MAKGDRIAQYERTVEQVKKTFDELDELLIDRALLVTAHEKALKEIDSRINLKRAGISATLSVAQSI